MFSLQLCCSCREKSPHRPAQGETLIGVTPVVERRTVEDTGLLPLMMLYMEHVNNKAGSKALKAASRHFATLLLPFSNVQTGTVAQKSITPVLHCRLTNVSIWPDLVPTNEGTTILPFCKFIIYVNDTTLRHTRLPTQCICPIPRKKNSLQKNVSWPGPSTTSRSPARPNRQTLHIFLEHSTASPGLLLQVFLNMSCYSVRGSALFFNFKEGRTLL
jgi:hypothetical protein